MVKTILISLLPLLALYSSGTDSILTTGHGPRKPSDGTIEKMIVAEGSVAIQLDLNQLSGSPIRRKLSRPSQVRFDIEPDSFFTVMVFNGELRGPTPGSMRIIRQNGSLPGILNAASENLVIENLVGSGSYEMVIRDGKTGFIFFNIEGHEYEYKGGDNRFNINSGRLLLSKDFAAQLGRPSEAGSTIGSISVKAAMRPIEVAQIVDGEVVADVMPALNNFEGAVPGPDVIVGDLVGLAQFGESVGTKVGLAVGTDSCNAGSVDLGWFANPNNDHPVIPQNLYRMSGGTQNDERFEQIGQSNVKHGFTALTQNICGFGCNGVGGTRLGSGCSDPYSASLNAGPNLGSRAWINPFSGFFPRNDSATPNNSHTGHAHDGTSHRVLTEISDLVPSQNPGATYYAEGQYVTPDEYLWCRENPGQCNMYNNVSYRQYNVTSSTAPFSFSPAAATVRTKAAINAWTGATFVSIEPAPGEDGVGIVAYKVSNPSTGVWHYEYAIYNENIDRAIQSFSIPASAAVTVSNIGFHAPPQHPGWSEDGTLGNAGYSSMPWTSVHSNGILTWSTETFAQNQNANAIRWGTTYNFRFDSNRPPQQVSATLAFFKTGAPITVQVQAPSTPAVSVGGRVATAAGFGIRGARVTISDASGNVRTSTTGTFGYYNFDNVTAGQVYTISVAARRYTFTQQSMMISNNVANLNFTPSPRS